MSSCVKFITYSYSSFIAFILFCLFFTVTISEIYIGIIYKDIISCDSPLSLYISLSNWLVIKGSSTIFSLLLYFPYIFSSHKSICYCITYILNFIINTCNLGWLIIGSIMFWGYCINLQPTLLNNYLWISLITGYIYICNSVTIFKVHASHHDR